MTFPPSGRISAKCPGKRMPDSNATIKLTTRASPQQGMPLCAGETDRNEHSAGRRSRNQRHQVAQPMLSERVSRHSSPARVLWPGSNRRCLTRSCFRRALRPSRARDRAEDLVHAPVMGRRIPMPWQATGTQFQSTPRNGATAAPRRARSAQPRFDQRARDAGDNVRRVQRLQTACIDPRPRR